MKYSILDKQFKPAIVELRKFAKDVETSDKFTELVIAIKRNGGYVFHKKLNVFKDGIDDERNIFIVERLIKTILWTVGGYEIYIAGSKVIAERIKSYYQKGGLRAFDYEFMGRVGGHLDGRRIGFDAGGSDRKVSSVVNGETIYSEEVVWFPKLNSNPQYHYDGIYAAMKTAIDKMGGDVDAIGVSSAGIYIDNRAMVASLFINVAPDDFEARIKNIYLDVVKQLETELGHQIPVVVANDGDVTALAGAMDLNDKGVLGVAMGTSEAVGYIDKDGNITGWLNELAFVPTDFNQDSIVDEWSLDFGVGCKYFSQDAVIKLAPLADIELDDDLSLAEKLKYVQKLNKIIFKIHCHN